MDALLTTKLYLPPPQPGLVSRPHLIERLDQGLYRGHRLTVVSAPAGFGKTTLAAGWLCGIDWPCAWVSLDEDDNDPARFFRYMIAALQQVDPGIGQAAHSVLGAPQRLAIEPLVASLINDIADSSAFFALALDDYHLIHEGQIHQALSFFLEHQPRQAHLVVVTRTLPPLPLPRLRARGLVTELGEPDLRFTAQETSAFLDMALGSAASPEVAVALADRTEGWIAGLQLAALSLRGRPASAIPELVAAFGGGQRHVLDYLADEVLAREPEEVRAFVCQTSVLERMSAPLCDEVLGRDDSEGMLRRLEGAGTFLLPLDDRRQWYRYHRLFAEAARTGLDAAQAAALHLRAAGWFHRRQLWPEAARHALACAALSGEVEAVSSLLQDACHHAIAAGEFAAVVRWLDALPDEGVRTDSGLAFYRAWALLVMGQVEPGRSYLDAAQANLPAGAQPLWRGRIMALRCYTADPEQVLSLAGEALDLIGDADPLSHGALLFALGDAQDALGDVAGAVETLREAIRLGSQQGSQVVPLVALGHLALSMNWQGRRREAAALCEQAIQEHVDGSGRPLPVLGLVCVTLGTLEYEADRLVQARQHIERGIALGRQSGAARVVISGTLELARVCYAQGEAGAALAALDEARRAAEGAQEPCWVAICEAAAAHLQLGMGDPSALDGWAAQVDVDAMRAPGPMGRYACTVYVHWLLSQGRPQEALALLDGLVEPARRGGLRRSLITVHVQRALAAEALGDRALADRALAEALRLAAPEGYVRAFVDEWPSPVGLLARARHVAPDFVTRLRTALGGPARDSGPAVRPACGALIEPLSERELEVLRLIAAGLLNREIARQLYIETGTVKRHINHIYGKLDVHSRTQAVARAGALRLL